MLAPFVSATLMLIEGDCCVLEGKPYILYGMWDYAEDWSGEFVREVHPFTLLSAPTITTEAFWNMVRAIEAERGK